MVLEVLQKQVEDVALPHDEKVGKDLGLCFGYKSLHNLIEIPAKNGL